MGPTDLIHGPDFVLPPAVLARRVVTIHDLAYLRYPEFAQPGITAFLSREVPRALRVADHIIAVSETTAGDLVQRLAVSPDRISVIYPGVDSVFTQPAGDLNLQEVRRLFQLAEPFILAVGTIEPRKNYETLIRAFAEASREPYGPRLLVFAGRRGWLSDAILNAGDRFQAADRIRFLGYVADDKLAALYQAATALAMPSHYEGFGVPLIEAMASGTPIIASTGGSLPEIAGNAALLVAPDDVGGLKDALLRICSDTELRDGLIARGRMRSQLFTWEAAARAHLRIYHDIYHEIGGRR
jgi:glycosyltransferase involved in cell wall biosynthesis